MSQPIRNIHVEDNPFDRGLVRHALETEHLAQELLPVVTKLLASIPSIDK